MTNAIKHPRFKTGKDLEFFSELRKRVDEYFTKNKISQHANAAMVIKTIVLLAAYIGPFVALCVWQPSFLIGLGLWTIMGFAVAGIGMSVMHDANHGAYSADEKINRLVGFTLNMLGGSAFNWKIQHNVLHHTYTNVTGHDQDIASQKVLRFSPHSEQMKAHKHQWYYAFLFYAVLTLYWGVGKDLVQYLGFKKQGLNRNTSKQNVKLFLKMSVGKILYFFVFLVLPVLVTNIPFYQILLGFLLMHAIAGIILSVVFQLAHTVEETEFPMPDENNELENAWAVHQLKTTANFSRNNKWISWYVGGLNFQVEHHLFPKICHVHYPNIAPIVEQTAKEYGVPYLENETFGQALKSHINFLKKMGVPPLDEIMG
jgi:linoleoyl-CoA desaturase